MSNIDKQANQVSRYDLVSGYMQKWPDGEFVYHSDYQALLDELEAKDKQIGDLKATAAHSNAGWKEAHEQEARAEAAERRIAELEAREINLPPYSFFDFKQGSTFKSGAYCHIDSVNKELSKHGIKMIAAAGKGE
ncbi:hypothetical protein [Enterobacter roggenkampii]|uniref:hypothetical protein n=1 Tax=Enterobacter roggenkampii TaxID=1812935 RepID=UPI003B8422C6